MKRAAFVVAMIAFCTQAGRARADEEAPYRSVPLPDDAYSWAQPQPYPSLIWFATQLVPSPEIGVGRVKHLDGAGVASDVTTVAFGLRWQVTPIVWSWGVHRRISRWRYFVVDPLARNSGSIELNTSFEYLWGDVNRFLARPGVRATFPILQRGEYLSVSMGTSVYQYDDTARVAYDFGAHFLYGIFGLQATIAPSHAPLRTIATLTLRYF